MRYIGCKRRLLPFIHQTMIKHNIEGKTFCDLFAGTATVGNYFKQLGFKIISSDLLYTSYVMQQVKIGINQMPSFERVAKHIGIIANQYRCYVHCYAQAIIDYLNQLNGIEGFIYQNYAAGGTQYQSVTRLYYTDCNAKKIDVIREIIEAWKQLGLINQAEFYILLYALLDEASKCANTTGTMSSFLKSYDRRSLRMIRLQLPNITPSFQQHQVYCRNSLDLLDEMDAVDILYLDPPYTNTQYAAAYHLLETIARWDFPNLYGVSGKRETASLHSPLSSKREAYDALKRIVASGRYRHLLMSYSNDSLMPHEALMWLFQQYGEVTVNTQLLKRYNSISLNDPRFNPRAYVEERLYYLKQLGRPACRERW